MGNSATPKNISKIFETFKKNNPHPTTELHYESRFQLLIAVILSAQATDESVNRATKTLFAQAKNPEAMLKLGITGLKQHIKSIGLYNSKAKHIIQSCQILSKHHYPHNTPDTLTELMALPGVGRKTANVILNTAFKQAAMPVDTHIFRLAHRLGFANGSTPLAVEKQLLKVIPKAYIQNAHHWLILHGRYICQARKPRCYACPIATLCPYPNKTPA
jgi:endonuclease III